MISEENFQQHTPM
ncbi:DNA mismatch repair protein MutS, partial [Haemophilus influenzae]